MKISLIRIVYILIVLFGINLSLKGRTDTISYYISLSYFRDLSDTYGGGVLFSGEFSIFRSWYGGEVSFGHFQSQPTFILKIPIEELNSTLEVPFDEISIMQIGTISGLIRPIQKKWITADILVGFCYGRARYLCFKGVDYNYDTIENQFTYLLKEYQLVKTNHSGYQIGFNISLYPLKKMGLQIKTRIQDLSNGGTFFFVGGGLCFKL
jgi:hypothetical protein